jgi:cytochrome P450
VFRLRIGFSSILVASNLEASEEKKISRTIAMDDLVAESGLLIVAGGDTTATGITATLFYLLRYTETFGCVRDEIDSAFERHQSDNVEVIAVGQTLSSCRLLQACIEEAMRLSPPVSGLLLRQVLQGGLLIAARWHVPAGTDVGNSSYAIRRCERYWQHPNQFKPERWLQKESQDCRSTLMPFGVGKTICVGKQLAK